MPFLNVLPYQILGKAFSHAALETYIPHLQDVVKTEIARWCLETGPIDVFAAAKALTFRIAVRIIIGLDVEESQINYLSRMFEQLMDNLFSLPVDVCCSGLRKVSSAAHCSKKCKLHSKRNYNSMLAVTFYICKTCYVENDTNPFNEPLSTFITTGNHLFSVMWCCQGIQAREVLHGCMEKMIEEKLQRNTEGCSHVFDYILSSAKEQGHELTMQELKVSNVHTHSITHINHTHTPY